MNRFDLAIPTDQPPTVGKPTATIDSSDAGFAWVIVDWSADDDGSIDNQAVLARIDGADPVVIDASTWPAAWVEVETGHTYRFIARVTDNTGQSTDSAPSDALAVP